MPSTNFGPLLFLMMVLAPPLGLAAAEDERPRDAKNLIAEPSFEGPLQISGLPVGWYALHAVPGAGYRFELADEGRTGRKSLLIEGKGQYGVAWGETIAIDRAKQYRARGYVRIEGDDLAAADVKLQYYGENQEYLGQSRVGFVNPRTPGWQLITVRDQVELSPKARFLGIAVALAGNGKAWFDDIELYAVAKNAEPVNYVANGDMEDVAADRPAGYFVFAAEGGTAQCRLKEEKPHSGKRCLALESKAEWAGAASAWIDIGGNSAFLVSGYVRTQRGKARLAIGYFDAAGKIIGRTDSDPVTAEDWQEVKLKTDFAKHPQTVKFNVAAFVVGDGAADFDDFRVIPAPEENLASARTPAQETLPKPSVSPEQQQRWERMKSKGPEASLTILPVRLVLNRKPMEDRDFRDRVTEVVGLFLEQKGLKKIELGKTAFDPATTADLERLAGSLAEFVKQHPIATDYVLFAELRTDGIHATVADQAGAVVWSDRLTAQDEPFKKGPPDPMVVCIALVDRLGPQLGLNQETAKAAKPGKMAAILAERGGQPPANETTPLPSRQAEMKKAIPQATLVVFSPRVRVADDAAETGNAADLAKMINEAGLCQAEPAKQSPLLKASQENPNEAKVMWDLAREFRGYVKKNPLDADYVLYADYRFNPQRWEAGFVHFIVCDRSGEWVIADLQNSHHPDYQSIKPTSRDGCDKILVKRLTSYVK